MAAGEPSTQAPIRRQGPPSKISEIYWKLSNFDPLSIFDIKRGKPYPREVLVNVPPPPESLETVPRVSIPSFSKKVSEEQSDGSVKTRKVKRGFGSKHAPAHGWIHVSNQVLTSKYNIITFLPRNLLEQFRRVANIFFLALVILQFFPRFTTVSPGLSALPLIVVLAITAIKDGYEDLKRHQSDRAINNIRALALRGAFHNHNLTMPKSRTFGMPSFIRNMFVGQSLVNEAEEAERDRQKERKKGFWGKRKIRSPKKKNGSHDDQEKTVVNGHAPEPPKDAPGGGTLQAGQAAAGKRARAVSEAVIPAEHERLEGDDYADDADAGASSSDGKKSEGGLHLPGFGHHTDKAVWTKEAWENLQVGDFVRLRGDESVPADILICATSEEENVCYVETKNLDGETNLKSRHAVPELTHLRTSSVIHNEAKFIVQSEPADVNMMAYNATVVLQDGRLGKDGKPLRCPATLNTMLLRGTVVRNTDWVIGVVIMTGLDTKIVLNSGGTPSKRSKVERLMNPMVFWNLLILGLMCMMCAIGDHFEEKKYYARNAPWMYGANRGGDNPSVNGIITFANALIAFQNIVPISLYISIEFVKLMQAFFIWGDNDIMYRNGDTKRRTMARSWNLSDDLGQIQYIFSDKTGTLTQNAMLFRQCSIAGKVYVGDEVAQNQQADAPSEGEATRVPSDHTNGSSASASGDSDKDPLTGDEKKKTKLADQVLAPFHDSNIEADLAKKTSQQAKNINGFFSNLALCHTVLAADEDGFISYKAQSPDEAALVQAAADVGFVFLGRDKNILRLQTPLESQVQEYELLNVLEFTSARKRMSVVVRKIEDGKPGRLTLLTKGADNIIFERLKPGVDEEIRKTTDRHLEDFANEGLRTLCLAYKPLDEDAYDAWEREFHDASTLIDGRDAAIERVSEKLEQDLFLLGATAIEDRLQDGVPEAIADLKRAGLKIWVATGDKLETAIAIGKTCNLLSRDMNIIIIKGGAIDGPNSANKQLRKALVDFFDGQHLVEQIDRPDFAKVSTRKSGEFPRPSMDRQGSRPALDRTVTGVSGMSDVVGEDNGQRPGGYGLVIDGSSLRHAFAEQQTKDLLLELGTRCRAVICCRTSPLQKAQIVRLVKDGLGAMCLAIGDGANDVSMIQAADIGVGVAGEEGLQAVNSSDYAIGQFRFLKRLLLVHGHWDYYRNAEMIVNFFYKEIIGIGILFFFQFYCGYSATIVYEYTYLLFWNVFWTLVPVIAMGVMDQNISERALMAVPELYRYGRDGKLFGLKRFAIYMIDGVYQSAVIYFFLLYAYDTTTARKDGYDVDMFEFSTVMAIAAVLAANFYNGLNTHSWNWWVLFGVLIGPVLILAYTAVYSAFPPSLLRTEVYGNNTYLWPSAYYWLGMLFTILLSLLPRYLYRFYKENYYPTDIDVLAWVAKVDPKHDWDHDPAMPHVEGSWTESKPLPADINHPFKSRHSNAAEQENGMQLGTRVTSIRSMTHDMSTGSAQPGTGRGFAFDQADAMLPAPIARYTSRGSERSSLQNRPRKGSIRLGSVELNPFLRTPGRRDRSVSLRQTLFGSGGKKDHNQIAEGDEGSPTKGSSSNTPPRPDGDDEPTDGQTELQSRS